MGGGDREPGPIREGLQQGRRQGRALAGIGACPHLIEKHQRRDGPLLQRVQDATDPLHMTAEGGEALLQGLLITDVRQHLGAPWKRRLTGTGKKHARASHEGRKADAFQGHGLAAGVGPRDRHNP